MLTVTTFFLKSLLLILGLRRHMCQNPFFFFFALQNCWTDANGRPPPAELIISTFEKRAEVGERSCAQQGGERTQAGQCYILCFSVLVRLCVCAHTFIHVCCRLYACMCACARSSALSVPSCCLLPFFPPFLPPSLHPFHVFIYLFIYFSPPLRPPCFHFPAIYTAPRQDAGRPQCAQTFSNVHTHAPLTHTDASAVFAASFVCVRARSIVHTSTATAVSVILVFCLCALK